MEEKREEDDNIDELDVDQPQETEIVTEPEEDNEVLAEPVKEKPKASNETLKKLSEKFGGKLPSFNFKINWNIKTWPHKIMHTLREYKRVIRVSKKPDIEELSEISKIAGLGILLIGLIGFILQTLFKLVVG